MPRPPHVGFGVHMGDPSHLNVERSSKVDHIKGVFVKTRVELLHRRHR
jgi:hypothetical protein